MPNHVTNVIQASREVLDSLKSEERDVDFNTVIPTPDNVYQGALVYGSEQEKGPNWYDFNIGNWGTKWNAYSIEREEGSEKVKFETAWSHPTPVIQKLSQKFPDEILVVTYADEDMGYNLGAYEIKNGEVISRIIFEPGSDEALEFAAQMNYGKSYARVRKEEWGEDDETEELESSTGHQLEM